MGRGAALPLPVQAPAPVKRSDELDELLGAIQVRIKALEKRPVGILKDQAEQIFDVVCSGMEKVMKVREEKLRKELSDIHTNALADIRTATRKLEALSAVNFDASVALVKSSINHFVGE